MVQCALFRWSFVSHGVDASSNLNLKCFQNGPDLIFDPGPPYPLGAHDCAQNGIGLVQVAIDQNIIVRVVIPDLLGRFPQPSFDLLLLGLSPRARSLCSRICREGARMKTVTASGICSFNCLAPCTSMSSTRSRPGRPGLLQDSAVGAVIIAKDLGPFEKLVARRSCARTPSRKRSVAAPVRLRRRAACACV